MKACVVDDDYTTRELLSDFLEDEGWKVIKFYHPEKESQNYNTTLVDELRDDETKLLIMDVRFGRDAYGLLLGLITVKRLVEQGELRNDLIVVFVSQFGKDVTNFKDIEKILENRDIKNHWMDKPIEFTFLNQFLRESV